MWARNPVVEAATTIGRPRKCSAYRLRNTCNSTTSPSRCRTSPRRWRGGSATVPGARVLYADETWGLLEAGGAKLAFVDGRRSTPTTSPTRSPREELDRLAAEHGAAIAAHRDGSRSFYLDAPGDAPRRGHRLPGRAGGGRGVGCGVARRRAWARSPGVATGRARRERSGRPTPPPTTARGRPARTGTAAGRRPAAPPNGPSWTITPVTPVDVGGQRVQAVLVDRLERQRPRGDRGDPLERRGVQRRADLADQPGREAGAEDHEDRDPVGRRGQQRRAEQRDRDDDDTATASDSAPATAGCRASSRRSRCVSTTAAA